jgi:hypothetical protein
MLFQLYSSVVFKYTITPENAVSKKDNSQHDPDRKYKSGKERGKK